MEFLRKFKLVRILTEAGFDRSVAELISEKLDKDKMDGILSEYDKLGKIDKKTFEYLKARFLTKNVSQLIFGVESELVVFPKILKSVLGSGKYGLNGLRNHLMELGYSESKFEEILLAFYMEAKSLSLLGENTRKLLSVVCFELANLYLAREDIKAKRFLNEAFELREELDEERLRILAENLKKLAYILEKNGEGAEKIVEKRLLLIEKMFENLQIDDKDYAISLLEIGKYYESKNPQKAIDLLKRSLKFEKIIPDRIQEIYESIIRCYRQIGNYEKSLENEVELVLKLLRLGKKPVFDKLRTLEILRHSEKMFLEGKISTSDYEKVKNALDR